MPPPNLAGLNIVHPVQNNFDSQDLLSGTTYPDLSAQLDLWTNLPFESEESREERNEEEETVAKAAAPALDISSLLAGYPFGQHQQAGAIAPSLAQLLALHSIQQTSASAVAKEDAPPPKRVRTRKGSDADDATGPPNTTPLSASEDKRRRNTAASARFRLKKKEREAALESKAKELEVRVNELERECEGLRRENGWLKGLVVGVTQGSSKRPRDEALE